MKIRTMYKITKLSNGKWGVSVKPDLVTSDFCHDDNISYFNVISYKDVCNIYNKLYSQVWISPIPYSLIPNEEFFFVVESNENDTIFTMVDSYDKLSSACWSGNMDVYSEIIAILYLSKSDGETIFHPSIQGIVIANDNVQHPKYYSEGRMYEPYKVIRDWGLNFNLGCAVKYIARAGRKDSAIEDLEKAAQYIQFELEALKGDQNEKMR